MRHCLATFVFLGAFLGLGPRPTVAAEMTPDERILTDNNVPTDGPGLLAFVRGLVLDEKSEARLKALVKQLGDDDFDKREEATRLLVAAGAPARPFLQEGLKESDPELVGRARKCLQQIDRGLPALVTSAAVRVLALRKPDGAAEALLNYLPVAEEESVAEEVRLALAALALHDGKPDPVLVAALADKLPAKRAAAGAALGRANAADQRDAVKKLLQDAEPIVRLRVGQALAARDKDALPVLIALLDNPRLTAYDLGAIEDVLYRLADDKAPTVLPGMDEAGRRNFRQAWEAWWKENGAKIEIAKLEEAARTRNFTLIVLLDKGAVADLDDGNKTRWQIDELRLPLDAQFLPGERVLIAEHDGGRVSERNRKGEVLWERKIDMPVVAQRLPNGNTFIATRSQLMELDPKKENVVFNHFPNPGELIMRAQKLRNGDIALVVSDGGAATRFVRLDPKGREMKSFPVNVRTSGGRIDVLPNGHVIVPENMNGRVVELDADGKTVWEVAIDRPIMALRLTNGNTLVTSMSEAVGAVEFDRAGKQVWQYKSDTRVTRAIRH
jgi:hypothetical protein